MNRKQQIHRAADASRKAESERSPWQPITTAPRNGQVVEVRRLWNGGLIACGKAYFGTISITYDDGITHTYENVWIREGKEYLMPAPTHWKPEPVQPRPPHPSVPKHGPR